MIAGIFILVSSGRVVVFCCHVLYGVRDNYQIPFICAQCLIIGLWGADTVQLYIYYNNYPKDALWLKTYVFTVWFLDTLHQALLIGMSHGYLIVGFGNFNILVTLDPLLVCALFVGGVICVMVQAIFVMRIWKLSERNILLVILVASLVVAQFGATCLVTSICAILGLVLGFVLFDTLLFMFFYLSITRLYTNSFLAALNSRNSLRRSLIKASSSFGVSNVPPTEVLKTVTLQAHYDDRSPAPFIVEPPNHSEGNTAASQFSVALDTVADNISTAPIKSQFPRSSDNWI
ncbi:hypothetical protein ACEPAI_3556 [Sanghuangporus weigelae]